MTLEALLIDLDGTLYVGDEAVPGAVDALRELARRGVPRRFVTNATRRSRRQLLEHLRRLGFEIDPAELFTAPIAAAAWLREQGIHRVALYLAEATREDFPDFEQTDDRPEAVVIGDLGEAWDFARLNRAFRQVMDGARLVAVHKNRYWMRPDGLALDAGAFVAALEYATGRTAELVGKPQPAYFRLVAASLGVPPERIAMVGDDLEADVGGAQAAGFAGVLVRTGKFREDQLARSVVRPDRILGSVAEVVELFRGGESTVHD